MARARANVPLAFVSFSTAATAVPPAASGSVVPVFSIAKSENRNQVQYVIGLDDHCAPVGGAPVSAYWRMLELGPTQTAPILPREVPAYGLASQVVLARDANGGQVRVALKALRGRSIIISTSRRSDGACQGLATTSIAGTPAHLFNVYVRLKWDGVDYLLLQGWSMDGSHVVRERLVK
jgi:uncharacterized protein DUF4833